MEKRVILSTNHRIATHQDAKILIDLGFEVFVPKKIPESIRSMAVIYDYDETLSIPKKDLEILNNFNFYEENITPEVKKIINKYFNAVIDPIIYLSLYNFVSHFEGTIFIRAYGQVKNMNYEKFISTVSDNFINKKLNFLKKILKPKEITYDSFFMRKIYKIKNRIYLAKSYKNIASEEPVFFQQRNVYMQLGLDWGKNQNSWIGNSKKILFVCPDIDFNLKNNNEYEDFKNEFKDFDYSIAGNQHNINNKKPEDRNILGFLENEDFSNLFKTHSCMFYSNQDNYVHYHPLEAIVFGMPLIYLKGGLLDSLGGENQPGRAENYKGAKEKIQRILNNDNDFIKTIQENQIRILNEFKNEYVKQTWEKNFLPIIEKN